jgi:hypothetical protein
MSLVLTDAVFILVSHNLSADFLLQFYFPFYVVLSGMFHLPNFTRLYACAYFAVVLISSVLHIFVLLLSLFYEQYGHSIARYSLFYYFIVFNQARVLTANAVKGLAGGLDFGRARILDVICKVKRPDDGVCTSTRQFASPPVYLSICL